MTGRKQPADGTQTGNLGMDGFDTPVTWDLLKDEQKQLVERQVLEFQKLCLESFSLIGQRPVQKSALPRPLMVGE